MGTTQCARPYDDYVQRDHQEQQLEPTPTESTRTPPLPPPGSLPAGSRVPNQGERADVQRMSQSSSSNDYTNPLYGLERRTRDWMASAAKAPPSIYDRATNGNESGYEKGNSGYHTAKHSSPFLHVPSSQEVLPIPKCTHKAKTHTPPPPKHSIPSYPYPCPYHFLHQRVHRQPLNKPIYHAL